MSRLEDLARLEDKRIKKLKLLLLGIMLSADDEKELIFKIKRSTSALVDEIKDIRKASFAVADKYSIETHRADESNRQLVIISASLYMLSIMAKRVAVSDKEKFEQKAKEAIVLSLPLIERLVATELYESNMRKMVVNNKEATFKWNAYNDKRTCDICSALDGNTYKAADLPDYPHPNCRCIAEIVSNQ